LSRRIADIGASPELQKQLGQLNKLFDQGQALPTLGATQGPDQARLKARMIASLDFIHSVFKAGYAPTAWKAEYANWDLDREIASAKAEILALDEVTVKDFQRVAKRVITSTQDYHVSMGFNLTESAGLPFTVLGTGGRYFIAWVDREKLPESSFPFQVGDELVRFGGRTVADVVQELEVARGKNSAQTDRALATLFLTHRSASGGLEVPKDPIAIAVQRKDTDRIITYQLAWDYTPEEVRFDPLSLAVPERFAGKPRWSFLRMDDMLAPQRATAGGPQQNPFDLGTRTSYLPALGEKIWESAAEDPFHAYIYRLPNGRVIGHVRIPSYMPEDVPKAIKHFGEIMARFEKTTDALVIDQINNPGGGVFYLYTLASMLSDQALRVPRHRIALTQADAAEAASFLMLEATVTNDEAARKALGPDLNGYPVSYQLFRFVVQYYRFILQEWNAGRTLTSPVWLYGVDQINPSSIARYTKPILFIINELDFSGGDFLPAILQDSGRVKIFGTRTAGAGGFVRGVEYPNLLGVQYFTVTGSLAERANGNPIENLGVQPDIPYTPTEADLREGFQDYVGAINAAVDGLLSARK
jgi:hypothetical protein